MNLKFCLPILLAVLAIGLVQAQTARYEFEYGTVGEHMYAVYPDAESRDGASNGQVIMFASGDPGE